MRTTVCAHYGFVRRRNVCNVLKGTAVQRAITACNGHGCPRSRSCAGLSRSAITVHGRNRYFFSRASEHRRSSLPRMRYITRGSAFLARRDGSGGTFLHAAEDGPRRCAVKTQPCDIDQVWPSTSRTSSTVVRCGRKVGVHGFRYESTGPSLSLLCRKVARASAPVAGIVGIAVELTQTQRFYALRMLPHKYITRLTAIPSRQA